MKKKVEVSPETLLSIKLFHAVAVVAKTGNHEGVVENMMKNIKAYAKTREMNG